MARYLVEIVGTEVYINTNDLVSELGNSSKNSSRMREREKKRPVDEE
jgi:hypothetical protein